MEACPETSAAAKPRPVVPAQASKADVAEGAAMDLPWALASMAVNDCVGVTGFALFKWPEFHNASP